MKIKNAFDLFDNGRSYEITVYWVYLKSLINGNILKKFTFFILKLNVSAELISKSENKIAFSEPISR